LGLLVEEFWVEARVLPVVTISSGRIQGKRNREEIKIIGRR